MTNPTSFLTSMAALSTAVQTFIDHAIKGRWKWLDTDTPGNPANESRRQSAVRLISFLVGAVLAYSVKLNPFDPPDSPTDVTALAGYAVAGLMVSYGSSFFNETLDTVRAFKKAQEGVRQQQLASGVVTSTTIS